jgi:hypothetical protein
MPLNVRSIAASLAVLCFFVISCTGWLSGLSPFICCKRAMIGAICGYVAGALAAKAINAVFISAMIDKQMDQRREETGDNDH